MARSMWKGAISFGLVHIPVEMYPATREHSLDLTMLDKRDFSPIGFKRYNKGNEKEVTWDNIVKGYEYSKGRYIQVSDAELDEVRLESTHTIDIERFVDAAEIQQIYRNTPYYVMPEGEYGEEAFAVLREAISEKDMVAIGRVVFRSREHMVAIKPRGKGMVLTTLLYPYAVRKPEKYFNEIGDQKIDKEMVAMAHQLIKSKTGHFAPDQFEDRYESALRDIIEKKMKGAKITPAKSREATTNVVNLMDALKKSIADGGSNARRPRPASSRTPTKKPARSAARSRKAG